MEVMAKYSSTKMVPKGSRPAARNSTAGWLAQCGGGMCRGIWLVRVGYCLISCLAASRPPERHAQQTYQHLIKQSSLQDEIKSTVPDVAARVCMFLLHVQW
jgi:hypothetical protein